MQTLAQSLVLLALSPLIAAALWVLFKLSGWLLYFIPGVNRLWGWLRLVFRLIFSRMVVEESPRVEIPLWH